MLILLGPEASGKSTLGASLVVAADGAGELIHSVKETTYHDYMTLMSGEKKNPIPLGQPFERGKLIDPSVDHTLDRWWYCELPYSEIIRAAPAVFTLKQFHNLYLLTLAYHPTIVLMTREGERKPDEKIPSAAFEPLLESYKKWLSSVHAEWLEWDYANPQGTAEELLELDRDRKRETIWWRSMLRKGMPGIGNTVNPKTLIIAEILSSNNVYRLPFEGGPSGVYLSELIDEAEIPLNSFYLTNWRKTTNNEENIRLLALEANMTGVQHAILLGAVAKGHAADLLQSLGITTHHIKHPGWVVNHSETIKEMQRRKQNYSLEWKSIWDVILSRGKKKEEGWLSNALIRVD